MKIQDQKAIMIVGNADSTFIKGYIKNVLGNEKTSISLISERNILFKDFYSENNVRVTAVRERSKVERIPFLRTINYIISVCRSLKNEKADLVIIHYAWPYLLRVYPKLHIDGKTVIVYWGSDLLRARKKELEGARRAVEKADRIVLLTEEMEELFLKQYGYGIKNKVSIIDFGVSAFDSIDKYSDKIQAKAELIGEQNKDKIVITIGYNAKPEQQHKKVIQMLCSLSEDQKARIVLLLPMTYPTGKEEYISEISSLANDVGFKNNVITKYMDETDVAKLCSATDVFVHAQTTDALSTSMLEHLYSGSIVLNGNWLHYRFLDKLGIDYIGFEFDELCGIISGILNENPKNNLDNKNILRDNCSWEKCRFLWDDLFDKL